MKIIGITLLIIGAILFFVSKFMYKKNKIKLGSNPSKSDEEFLALLNNETIVMKVIGSLIVVAGTLIIVLY